MIVINSPSGVEHGLHTNCNDVATFSGVRMCAACNNQVLTLEITNIS